MELSSCCPYYGVQQVQMYVTPQLHVSSGLQAQASIDDRCTVSRWLERLNSLARYAGSIRRVVQAAGRKVAWGLEG
jgi:hypothetical protein